MINNLYSSICPKKLKKIYVRCGISPDRVEKIFESTASSLFYDSWNSEKPFVGECRNGAISLRKRKRSKYDSGFTIVGSYNSECIQLSIVPGDWVNIAFGCVFSIFAGFIMKFYLLAIPVIIITTLPLVIQREQTVEEAFAELEKHFGSEYE